MPARRPGGKAVSRKARQRNVPRAPRPASTPAPTPPPDEVVEAAAEAAPVLDAPVAAPAPAPSQAPARRRSSPGPSAGLSSGSGLSAAERSEYHYVERDLRNIGVLSLVMLALLVVAWLIFNALGHVT